VTGSGKTAFIEGLTKIHRKGNLKLRDLRDRITNSKSEIQKFFSHGWIRVFELQNDEFYLETSDLMDLWKDFRKVLLHMLRIIHRLDKVLALWKMLIYVLQYLLFSEFPNRLRPPCTTMPWNIWPSLVVLWGVCWMFYKEFASNLGDEGPTQTINNATNIVSNDSFQGKFSMQPVSRKALTI
jgi:hypothetical protein